jgi:hypothetical protein
MTAPRKFPIPYDYFKAIVALFLLLLILWSWRNGGSPPTMSIAVDPSGVVTVSGGASPGATAGLTLRHPDGSLEKLTAKADDAGRWLVSKRLQPGNYEAIVAVGVRKSPPQGFEVPSSAALAELTIEQSAGNPYLVSGRAAPNSQLLIVLDGKTAGHVTTRPDGSWSYQIEARPGNHVVQAVYAEAPQIASVSMTFELPKPFSPSPTIDETQTDFGVVHLSGRTAPGGTVNIWANGNLLQTVVADETGDWSASLDLPPGKHEIRASSNVGGEFAEPPLFVTVPTAPKSTREGFAYTVKEDDWLSKLAYVFLGSEERYQEIREATNAKAKQDPSFATIEDDNLIYPGEKIWIPTP